MTIQSTAVVAKLDEVVYEASQYKKALEKANASLTTACHHCDDALLRGDILQVVLSIREALEK